MKASDTVIEAVKSRARVKLEQSDDAHGYNHAERVANMAESIRAHEGGNQLIIAIACYTHDWFASKGRAYHISDEALREIRTNLETLKVPETTINPVIEVIRHHEDFDFGKRGTTLSKECQIVQDADRLDALGAIGIGRCFFTKAKLNQPFGTPEDMKRPKGDYDDKEVSSAIQHFYTKLLNLADNMNTDYARKLAKGRHDFMVEYLRRFGLEWAGKI